jgi:acyl-CoA reductase-like NAD-dependent aldehyde dehydrogenase
MNVVCQVSSDEEAIRLMNDSPYGLTASIWTNAEKSTESQDAFLKMVDELDTGTVFLNRRVRFYAVWNDGLMEFTKVRLVGPGTRLDRSEEQWAWSQFKQIRCVIWHKRIFYF